MCIVFFTQATNIKGVKKVIIFNRDEDIKRERTPLGIHFDPKKILCGVDKMAEGTWLGVNLDTGNIGFLTNYCDKMFIPITDPKYRRGNLLMNFLKADLQFDSLEHYKEYLNTFITVGDKFNGCNIWLGNVNLSETIFAHNQPSHPNFSVIDSRQTVVYGNGSIQETWFKQTLGQQLLERALTLGKDQDLSFLKEILFKVAECSHKSDDPKDWPSPKDFLHPSDPKENSSIFVNSYESCSGDGGKLYYATVSTTVILQMEDNTLHFWERLYNLPGPLETNPTREINEIDLKLEEMLYPLAQFSRAQFHDNYHTHKFQ